MQNKSISLAMILAVLTTLATPMPAPAHCPGAVGPPYPSTTFAPIGPALNTIEEMSLRDGYRFEQTMTGELGKTEDSKEAMRAFVEKRPPNFKGR